MTEGIGNFRRAFLPALGFLVFLAIPRVLLGQEVAKECSSGWSTLGSIGVQEFTCDCTYNRTSDETFWRFRAEPVIRRVIDGGPADGKLRSGDVIVAIDGLLITTRAGGERIANLETGRSVVITVRRNGKELEFSIVTDESCALAELAQVVSPAVPSALAVPVSPSRASSVAGTAPLARTAALSRGVGPAIAEVPVPAQPNAWFGFGITCSNCSVNSSGRRELEQQEVELRATASRYSNRPEQLARLRASIDALRRRTSEWHFSDYPSVYSVDPGSPADRAGLRRGDILTAIDGVSLLTPEGGQRFGSVEPGQPVAWTYRRGGSTRSARMTAIDPPENPDAVSLRSRYENLVTALEELHSTDSAALTPQLRQLRERLETAQVEHGRLAEIAPEAQEQHLRFAGMVGNTSVEVRGLGSVEVSFDNATGDLLIHTTDATIRMKAPPRR